MYIPVHFWIKWTKSKLKISIVTFYKQNLLFVPVLYVKVQYVPYPGKVEVDSKGAGIEPVRGVPSS